MPVAIRHWIASVLLIICSSTAVLSQTTLETQAREFLQEHGLLDEVTDGQTLLFTWDGNEAAFVVKESLPVQVPLTMIAASRPSKFQDHHILYATKQDGHDTYEDVEGEFGGGGVLELLTGVSEEETFCGNVTIFTW